VSDLPAPGGDGDEDLGPPVEQLRDLEVPLGTGFTTRVRGRIERRLFASHLIDLAWAAPLAVLLELLRAPFEALEGRGPRVKDEGGSMTGRL
jgi:hypothetical protein